MIVGYQRTGYSEPFMTDVDINLGDVLESTVIYTETNIAATTITSAITINNTEHRNSPTYGVVGATLGIGAGNGTTIPLVLKYHTFRVGDIFEDAVGYAYEIISIDDTNITLNRDVVASIPIGQHLLTVARKIKTYELKASRDYVIGDKVVESVGSINTSTDPYPLLTDLNSVVIPDTTNITDLSPTRTYYFNTSNFSSVMIDVITTRGATVILTPLLSETDLTIEGKPSTTTTIADGGGIDRMKYTDIAAPNVKVVVTKTQANDTTNYFFSVHGIK